MTQHHFLLKPSSWLGQGKIQLNMVTEELGFFTKWSIGQPDGDGRILCAQEIQIKGLSEVMHNEFYIYNLANAEFEIDLENQALGKISGRGLVNDKVIGWEFRIPEIGFDGYEFYEKQEDGNYLIRAEYSTNDQFRTVIEGRLWQQTE